MTTGSAPSWATMSDVSEDAKRAETIRSDMIRCPYIITLGLGESAVARLIWCMEHFGPLLHSEHDNWTYWNEQYVGGLPSNVMYMFGDPNHAMLFKLRWAGAKQ